MPDVNTSNLNLVLMAAGEHADNWGGAQSTLAGPPFHPVSLNDNFQVIDRQFPTGLTGPIGKIARFNTDGSMSVTAINVVGPAVTSRWSQYFTGPTDFSANKLRWAAGADSAAEGGATNAGSDYQVISAKDDGSFLDVPFQITRSSSVAAFSQIPTAAGSAVVTQSTLGSAISGFSMVGEVRMWAGTGDPTGSTWMICDGRAVSRSLPLFGVISTAYGNGDGTSTFNIPDLRQRVAVGGNGTVGDSGRISVALTPGYSATPGSAFGEGGHLLSTGEMPSHSHPLTDPGHTHTFAYSQQAIGGGGSSNMITGIGAGGQTATTASHTTGITEGAIGGGGAHNLVQPSIVLNYIIRVQ
jgi:microcystin-dependent protein